VSGGRRSVLEPARSAMPVRRRTGDPGVPIEYVALAATNEATALEAGRSAGFEAGYAEGWEAAHVEAREQAHQADARLERALAALEAASCDAASAFAERRDQLERSVTDFAFELVQTLVGRELALAAHPGRDAVARALATDVSGLPATVRLHPEDADALGDADAQGALATTRAVTIVSDASVTPGGALVEIGDATIDGQLTTALQRVREVLVAAENEDGADIAVQDVDAPSPGAAR
jgi:flagellar assembly protein FliH